MKPHEIELMQKRMDEYRRLEKRCDEIRFAINEITRGDPTGPCEQGPFTGNTRESRQISMIDISFTATLGGAKPVNMHLEKLFIHAGSFGDALKKMLEQELAKVVVAMETL